MKKVYLLINTVLLSFAINAQCEINVSADQTVISCGECVTLTAFGANTALTVLNEDFNTSGFGAGWGGTPGAVNFSNPCSGGGVDGSPHAWMDDNTDVPRELVSATYDFSTAAAGVSICFDMLFAEQGDASPCEGPDEADEGVYLEYSTNGGTTWTTINYFDPNGGNDAQLTNWNNYCFDLPLAAITGNTSIRWYQDEGSGQDYDHWGIDNVQIFVNDITSEVSWIADAANGFPSYSYGVGVGGGDLPTQVCPSTTTTYEAQIVTGTGDVCTSDITIVVNPVIITSSISASTTTICTSAGECADITVDAEVEVDPGGPITFENIQPIDYGNGLFGSGAETVNINVQDLNMTTVSPGSITQICIDYLTFEPSSGLSDGVYDLEISIACPDGSEITLVPDSYAPQGEDGGWFGTDYPSYYQNVCFVPAAAQTVNDIGNGSAAALPITGSYQTYDSFTGLEGCTSNGVWELHLDNDNFWGGDGTLTGWSITFNDDPLLETPNFTWTPEAGLDDPNILTPTTCTPGTYTIDIEGSQPGCGSSQESITINGSTGGDASFTTTDYCFGAANSATITGDTGGSFAFNPAVLDGATINSTNGTISDGVAGTTYTIEYTVTGACDATSTETVTVLSGSAAFTTTDFCEGAANSATITGDIGGTFTFNPTVADGATINGTTGEIADGVGGATYTIEYTTSGTCASSSTENVSVNSSSATFTIADFCDGDVNNATITGNSGGTFTFNPIVADGATINGTTGEISNGIAGTTYTIEYTTTGTCGTSTTETVTVLSGSAAFTTTDFCEGATNSVTITGDAGGTFAFNPTVSDGATINSSTGEITDGVGGTTYTLEYTSGGTCSQIETETVLVINSSATFTTTDFCEGATNSATITGDAGGTFTFNPTAVDGATINATTGEITDGINGTTYTLEYSTVGTCPTSTTQTVDVINNEDAAFTINDFCENAVNSATIDGTTGGNFNFTAPVVDGATINNTNGSISNGVPGTTYSIDYTTTGTCPSTETETLNVLAIDDATFTLTDFCDGSTNSATVTGLTGGSFDFTTPFPATIDSSTGEITNGSINITYNVEYTTNGACPNSSIETVNIIALDDPSFTLTDYCEGSINTANITGDAGGIFSFNPVVADGATINSTTGEITNGIGGSNYTIEYTTSGTCPSSSTETVAVQIIGLPTFTTTDFCSNTNNTASITGNTGGTFTFNPTPSDFATINSQTGEISNTTDGETYSIEYTTSGTCPGSTIETVIALALPDVNFTANEMGCAPLDVEFINNSPNSINCLWDFGNGLTSSNCGNTTNTYENEGLYSVTLTIIDINNCQSTLTENDYILVEPAPEAIFNVNNHSASVDDPEITFINNSTNAVNFEWNFGDEFYSFEESPTHFYPQIGDVTYDVQLIASNDIGCADTTNAQININDLVIYYVPNAFTPDGDEYNQTFKPIFTSGHDPYDYHLFIFNRWGELVFESYNAEFGWDGTYGDGGLCPDGVYTWRINFKESVSDNRQDVFGHVVLLE